MKHQLCSLPLLFPLAFSGLAAAPPPEKLLAADTVAVFTIPEYARSKAAWNQWPASQLWADPAMKPFKEKFVKKFQSDLVAPLEKEFGIKFSDYSGLAQGQVTLALTPNAWNTDAPKEPGALFLLDSRDKSDALKASLATLKTKWVDSGKQVRVEKIRDIEFTALIFKTDDLKKALKKAFSDANEGADSLEPPKPDKPARTLELLVGQSGSLLVVGTSAKDIEKVLSSQSGGGVATLAEQTAFAPSFNSLFRDAHAYGWVNTKSIMDVVLKGATKGGGNDQEGPPMAPRMDKLLAASGLTGLQTIAFNLRDSGDGCVISFNLNVPEAQRRGLFKLLSFEAKDAAPPPFVPIDVVKFSRLRLDLQKAWTTLENAVVEAIPQAAGFIKLIVDNAGKDKDPDFDLRKNLIANLGDDVISCQKAPRKHTLAELNSPPSLYLVGSSKAEQVASAVKALGAVLPQPKVKEREFLGRTVYTLGLPPTPVPGGGKPVERTLHYTASGGYVALSTDVAMLEEFLRSGDSAAKALRDTPGLASAAQKIGGLSTGMFGYENQQETARALVETLKKDSGTLASLFGNSPFAGRFGMDDSANKLKEWVDFSLLPPFDAIAKYFYLNLYTGSVTGEGFSFKIFTPNPPQLRK
jgi:hypothetical protein